MGDTLWIETMLAMWSAGDGDAVAAYFAPDGVWEDVTMPFRHEGRAAIADMWSRVPKEFSADSEFEVGNPVDDDDRYAFQWRWTGTHDPTGRRFDIRGVSLGVRRNGLIVHHFDYWNPAHLAEQIGPDRIAVVP
jgi:uncharacterized protein (TIGR02246 family)